MRKRIGECLVQAGLMTENDLRTALAERRRTGERLGAVLARLNLATDTQIAKALAFQLGFPYLSLAEDPPDPAAAALVPKEVALKRVCVAVKLEKNLLTMAMSDPLQFSLVEDLEARTGYRIRQVVATRSEIAEAIDRAYAEKALVIPAAPPPDPAEDPPLASDSAPISDLVERLVKSAIRSQASDIHVEPAEKGVLIRHRLDGLLTEVMTLPTGIHDGLIARMKTLAGMDPAEKRLPQDGRLRSTSDEGAEVDFRVSSLRTMWGEKLVLRVLDHRKGAPALDGIGMSAASVEDVRRFLRQPRGLILVVGPTASGKSTTLASALKSAQSEKTNIVTVEDPIDYQIPGVNQTQLNDTSERTFASALRSILRQDPDVILVGELRDAETATIAVQAAQTGHLVLSSLYTDDAPSAVTRLAAFGTEPYAVASALAGVIAQRLVRRLCTHCRRPYTPSHDMLRALNLPEPDAASLVFYKAVGCDQCHHTGYRGRIGLYEVMGMTDTLRRLIASRAAEDQLREAALSGGMVSLGEDGLAKVKTGITTPEELLRVVTAVGEWRALCVACGTAVSAAFVACPNCGTRVGAACAHCGRAMQPGWQFCPYCARSTAEPKRPLRPVRGHELRLETRRERRPANVSEFRKHGEFKK